MYFEIKKKYVTQVDKYINTALRNNYAMQFNDNNMC